MPWKHKKRKSPRSLKKTIKTIGDWSIDLAIGLLLLLVTFGLINYCSG